MIDLHEINNNTDLSRILNELNDFTNIHLKKKNSVINVQEYTNESQIIYASIITLKLLKQLMMTGDILKIFCILKGYTFLKLIVSL